MVEQEVRSFLQKTCGVEYESMLFGIAVSGGLDSMVLLSAMQRLGLNVYVLHVNFQLRGEDSNQDELLVRTFAQNMSVPFEIKSFDTDEIVVQEKKSIQLLARELRYKWFEEKRKEKGLDYILTAHHQQDVLETFFVNLSRGAGSQGLKSIPAQNKSILRPLLELTKDELKSYALENNILWREDASNQKLDYLRNKIRHSLIPTLKEVPNMEQGIIKSMSYLKEETLLIQESIRRFEKEYIEKIDNGYKIVAGRSDLYLVKLKKWLIQQGFTTSVNEIVRFVNQEGLENGKTLEFGEWKLTKKTEQFVLRKTETEKETETNYELEENRVIDCLRFRMKVQLVTKIPLLENDIVLDYTKVKLPLSLRSYESGDFFYPENSKYRKKLGKFLRDSKVTLEEKSKVPVFVDNDGLVLVVGTIRDKRFLPEEGKQKLILRCENY